VGEDWPMSAYEAARTLTGSSETTDSVGIELLRDMREAFNVEACDRLTTSRLIERLVTDDTARWADYSRGRSITSAQIAKLLKRYGFAPGTGRLGDTTAKGYRREQFAEVFNRYLLPLSPTTGVPAVTASQANEDRALGDITTRNMGGDVTAASNTEPLDSLTLLRCDGSRTQNRTNEAMPWRIEL
jgi:hypothetical protein